MPHDKRSLEPICAKNVKTSPNGSKKKTSIQGRRTRPIILTPPPCPKASGVSTPLPDTGSDYRRRAVWLIWPGYYAARRGFLGERGKG